MSKYPHIKLLEDLGCVGLGHSVDQNVTAFHLDFSHTAVNDERLPLPSCLYFNRRVLIVQGTRPHNVKISPRNTRKRYFLFYSKIFLHLSIWGMALVCKFSQTRPLLHLVNEELTYSMVSVGGACGNIQRKGEAMGKDERGSVHVLYSKQASREYARLGFATWIQAVSSSVTDTRRLWKRQLRHLANCPCLGRQVFLAPAPVGSGRRSFQRPGWLLSRSKTSFTCYAFQAPLSPATGLG